MNIRMIFCLFFCLSLFAGAAAYSQEKTDESGFFSTLNDVPLMPGLEEIPDQTIVFDKPGGRIAETIAIGDQINKEDIENFYSQTLPQLGWYEVERGNFVRENESLSLSIELENQHKLVRIMVEPRE
jgi:hypothetical protein